MERVLYVSGMAPYAGKAVNDFLKSCDLGGLIGGFVPKKLKITLTVADDATPEQIARQPAAVVVAFEAAGWVDVRVSEAAGPEGEG
jgi:hypothetical protein